MLSKTFYLLAATVCLPPILLAGLARAQSPAAPPRD